MAKENQQVLQQLAKNKRKAPFQVEEKDYLVKLMKENRTVLESKVLSRDIKDIKWKADSWIGLTNDFNRGCSFSTGRTTVELRKKWENLKVEAKKQSSVRKEIFLSGGGLLKLTPYCQLLSNVALVIEGAMEPIPSKYDSDANSVVYVVPDLGPCTGAIEMDEDDLQSSETNDEHLGQSSSNPVTPSVVMHTAKKKRKLDCCKNETPGAVNTVDGNNRQADDLHIAKMGYIAQKLLMKREEHPKIMGILELMSSILVKQADTNVPEKGTSGCTSSMLSHLRNLDATIQW